MAFYNSSQGITAVASSTPKMGSILASPYKRSNFICPICSEIFFEPTTTYRGHCFCTICLQSAIEKNGQKCPKCNEFISKEPGAIHQLLWNLTRRFFPQEVEARRQAIVINGIKMA